MEILIINTVKKTNLQDKFTLRNSVWSQPYEWLLDHIPIRFEIA